MDIRKVKKLIEMLEDSSLEEIEIQEGEESQFRKNRMIVIPLILRWLEPFMPLLHLAQNRLYL